MIRHVMRNARLSSIRLKDDAKTIDFKHQPLNSLNFDPKRVRKLENIIYHPLNALINPGKHFPSASITADDDQDSDDHKNYDYHHNKQQRQHSLTDEQKEILDLVTSPHRPCIFFTGQAGTGKTFLIRRIVSDLTYIERAHHGRSPEESIAVCSMTGISATHINGQTLHSWAGFGLANTMMSPGETLKNIMSIPRNQHVRRRWRNVRTLIIDECSMLPAETLDLLDYIGRAMKRRMDRPFGGIQVILCGDFMQLPPVVTKEEVGKRRRKLMMLRSALKEKILDSKRESAWLMGGKVSLTREDYERIDREFPLDNSTSLNTRKFCFDAKSWKYIIDGGSISDKKDSGPSTSATEIKEDLVVKRMKHARVLKKPFRQQQDPLFSQLLNLLRREDFSPRHANFPVVDAILSHLSMPFEERPYDWVFQMLASCRVKRLEDLSYMIEYNEVMKSFRFKSANEVFAGSLSLSNDGEDYEMAVQKVKRIADPTFQPTVLFSSKLDTDRYNMNSLMALHAARTLNKKQNDDVDDDDVYFNGDDDSIIVYDAVDSEHLTDSLLPKQLVLRTGAQVMLLKNIRSSAGLVNGMIGVVTKFVPISTSYLESHARIPKCLGQFVKSNDDKSPQLMIPVVKFPLLINATDLSHWVSPASIDWIHIDPIAQTIEVPIAPRLECEAFSEISVKSTDGENKGRKGSREQKVVETVLKPTRLQIPLRLAWSYSIHKSQGQTLPKVQIEVDSLFEYGQMYVGLSRATSLPSLRILGYAGSDERLWKYLKHEKVVRFYRDLQHNDDDASKAFVALGKSP